MLNRPVDLISPNIKNLILERVKYLNCNPQYYLNLGSMTKKNLEEESDRHSVGIEIVCFNDSNSESRKIKQREKHRCERNLKSARNWAMQNFSLPLTRDYVELVGAFVEPMTNDQGFRKDKVRVSGSIYSPPSPEKLEREFRIFTLENESLKDPLERALHAHLGIARVHPFQDGNGRTARLVQDIMLSYSDLPLPLIPLYERPEYIKKVRDAVTSYYEREGTFFGKSGDILSDLRELATHYDSLQPSQKQRSKYLARLMLSLKITPEQNAFYDFMALKVFNGLSDKLKGVYSVKQKKANL